MEKCTATFFTINLGLKWRKWLVTLDKTEASKEKALKASNDFCYPAAGVAKLTEAPWVLSES